MKAGFFLISMVLMVGLSTGTAFSACTQEEMMNKAVKVASRLEQLKDRDAMEYQRILLRFNNIARQIDQNDIDAWCAIYDRLLLEL
jgi:hypothetical protein